MMKDKAMNVFVVTHGDNYDRGVVGVALSLDGAKALARSSRLSPGSGWFGISQYAPGTPGIVNGFTEDQFDLD